MRLINVVSLELQSFMGAADVPRYAILSHTWEDDEMTLQDLLDPTQRDRRKGLVKIAMACKLAQRDDIGYVWVDTCCIDKSSSAELTEAINSMFRWYSDAEVCYTWLADLPARVGDDDRFDQLRHCRWFTRGWTLQELIAPRRVEFYDEEWALRGDKTALGKVLTSITGINKQILRDPTGLETLSVAERMSWAAARQTTRIEDMAYCLLGIFEVNMPMLYGEGARAFQRLQEEIAKDTNDLSLFAWRSAPGGQAFRGIFADSPAEFRGSGSVELTGDTAFNSEYTLTNKGLNLAADLAPGVAEGYFINLNCSALCKGIRQRIGVWIRPHGGGVYSRVRASEFSIRPVDVMLHSQRVFISKRIGPGRSGVLESSHNHAIVFRGNFNQLTAVAYPDFGFAAQVMHPPEEWDPQRRMFMTHGAPEFAAYGYFIQRAGFDFGGEVVVGESFIVAVGRAPGMDGPWATIGSIRDGAELFQVLGDAKKLAELATARTKRCAVLIDGMLNKTKIVGVSLEKSEENGQTVYFIDIVYHEYSEELHATLKARDLAM